MPTAMIPRRRAPLLLLLALACSEPTPTAPGAPLTPPQLPDSLRTELVHALSQVSSVNLAMLLHPDSGVATVATDFFTDTLACPLDSVLGAAVLELVAGEVGNDDRLHGAAGEDAGGLGAGRVGGGGRVDVGGVADGERRGGGEAGGGRGAEEVAAGGHT